MSTCNADQAGHDEAGHEGEGEGDVGEGEDGAVPGGEDQANPAEEVEDAKKADLPARIVSHLQSTLLLFFGQQIACMTPFLLFIRPHNHFSLGVFLRLDGVYQDPCRCGVLYMCDTQLTVEAIGEFTDVGTLQHMIIIFCCVINSTVL